MGKLNFRIENWLSARAESESTRTSYLRHINAFSDFCQDHGEDFSQVVESWRTARYNGAREEQVFLDRWHDLIRAYTTHIKSRYAPLSRNYLLSILRSFFRFHRIPLNVDLLKHPYTLYHNRDLTREQLKQILSKASQRDRTIWLMMAESGLRGSTAVMLRFWQIRDDFEKGIVPMRILTPAESLKDHVGDRWSFIGEDGVKALREYLQPRLPLKDQDFVFASEKPGKMKGEQFSVQSLSVLFSRVVRSLNLEKGSSAIGKPGHYRMHGLRKYFRNNMKADPSYREFWMGHSLGVDAHYVSRDPEFHRKEYKKGYEQLRILEPVTPAQLKDINDQLRQKDLELKELKVQNERLSARIDELAEPLKILKEMDIEKLTKDEERTPLGLIIQYLRIHAGKELNAEIQKLKKAERAVNNDE
jgi:site-specific recombinase XerD